MQVIGDVKCYHCGHVSGQIEGTRTDKLVLNAFKPRAGFQGTPPGPGDSIRCDRCGGPVFLEELQPVNALTAMVPPALAKKRKAASQTKAA